MLNHPTKWLTVQERQETTRNDDHEVFNFYLKGNQANFMAFSRGHGWMLGTKT